MSRYKQEDCKLLCRQQKKPGLQKSPHKAAASPRKPLAILAQPQQPQGSAPGHVLRTTSSSSGRQQLQQQHQVSQQQRQEPPDTQERVMRTVYLPTSSSDTLAMRVDALQAQLEEQVPGPPCNLEAQTQY